jgi:hypothetical protein
MCWLISSHSIQLAMLWAPQNMVTSFTARLVAGVCAQFMSYYDGPQTKAEVYNMLIDFSLKDIVNITGGGDTPNRLVNNGANTKGWPQRDELKV